MHTAAILGDAADHIHELQTSVEKYEEELRQTAADHIHELQTSVEKYEEELRQTAEERFTANNDKETGCNLPNENQDRYSKFPKQISDNQGWSGLREKKQAKVEIEVNQIGAGDFLLRITCQKRQGAFFSLMEAIDVSGLQVLDANITTNDASVLNILRVVLMRTSPHMMPQF